MNCAFGAEWHPEAASIDGRRFPATSMVFELFSIFMGPLCMYVDMAGPFGVAMKAHNKSINATSEPSAEQQWN